MNETTAYKSDDVLEIRNPVMMHLILTFMGSCLLLAALLAAFAPLPYAENPMIMRIGMGYCGIPVSIGLIYMNVRKLIKRRNAIRIDLEGITDNTTAPPPVSPRGTRFRRSSSSASRATTTSVRFPRTTTRGTPTSPSGSNVSPRPISTRGSRPSASSSRRSATGSPRKRASPL